MLVGGAKDDRWMLGWDCVAHEFLLVGPLGWRPLVVGVPSSCGDDRVGWFQRGFGSVTATLAGLAGLGAGGYFCNTRGGDWHEIPDSRSAGGVR